MINGFTIFGLKIYFYALIIITGALLGAYLASREAKRRGFDPEMIWDALPWLLFAGIIGARIWHILTPPASMLIDGKNPYFIFPQGLLEMLNVRNGGLGIPGAVMAGVLALWIYARKKKISFASWLDIAAPGLALAQAIGRWGNFFNQEVYGLPSKLPWAIFIDAAHRLPGYENIERYHPTFFYEFLWSLLNMFLLLWLSRKFSDKLKKGDIFLVYLIVYPVGRFLLEFIRLEYSPIAGININQTVMAVIAVLSSGFLIYRHLKKAPGSQEKEETRSISE
jgi:phosphatidylglycerol:prolipoprotein diacylglycerol transferase